MFIAEGLSSLKDIFLISNVHLVMLFLGDWPASVI
jgi:hypothetical protein